MRGAADRSPQSGDASGSFRGVADLIHRFSNKKVALMSCSLSKPISQLQHLPELKARALNTEALHDLRFRLDRWQGDLKDCGIPVVAQTAVSKLQKPELHFEISFQTLSLADSPRKVQRRSPKRTWKPRKARSLQPSCSPLFLEPRLPNGTVLGG